MWTLNPRGTLGKIVLVAETLYMSPEYLVLWWELQCYNFNYYAITNLNNFWRYSAMPVCFHTHTQIHTHRWTVMTEIMGYWKAAGSKLLKVEPVPCYGEEVWRFSRLGIPLRVCLCAMASVGCLLLLPALVRKWPPAPIFFAVRKAWEWTDLIQFGIKMGIEA